MQVSKACHLDLLQMLERIPKGGSLKCSVEPVLVYNRNGWILNGKDFLAQTTQVNQVPTMTNGQLTTLQFGII